MGKRAEKGMAEVQNLSDIQLGIVFLEVKNFEGRTSEGKVAFVFLNRIQNSLSRN